MPYQPGFIDGFNIKLPSILKQQDIAPLRSGHGHIINYHHHSVAMNKKRKQAFFSASNIDGTTWQPIERTGGFVKDTKNLDPEFQLGDELYKAIAAGKGRKNDFDEGHLTSFQEVLWGDDSDKQQAGDDTFFFTNCVPQHSLLNRGAWKSLEQFITRKGTDDRDVKVAVFTGPVLSPKDPFFIKKISGEFIRIPVVFWKVIFYHLANRLNAVGFMMSHKNLLLDEETVTYDKSEVLERGIVEEEEDVFMNFPKSTTYQVKVELIEKATNLAFDLKGVNLPFKTDTAKEIVYKRIEVERGFEEAIATTKELDYDLKGLTL
jgi:endonuclease G